MVDVPYGAFTRGDELKRGLGALSIYSPELIREERKLALQLFELRSAAIDGLNHLYYYLHIITNT